MKASITSLVVSLALLAPFSAVGQVWTEPASPFCGSARKDLGDSTYELSICFDEKGLPIRSEDGCKSAVPTFQGNDDACVWILPPTRQPVLIRTAASTKRLLIKTSPDAISIPDSIMPAFSTSKTLVDLGDDLQGCFCDQFLKCTDAPSLANETHIHLCVASHQSGVQLVGVQSLTMSVQLGNHSSMMFDYANGVHMEGYSARCSGNLCHIRAPLDADFYSDNVPGELFVRGAIVVAMPNRRRALRAEDRHRSISISCPLAGNNSTTAATSRSNANAIEGVKFFIVLMVMMVMVIGVCWWITRKADSKRVCCGRHA
jgi:hypothetical protein